MRVIAGSARSLKLKTLEGDITRPTTDKTKETLFNVLSPDVPGSVFIDLFSGSGAIGIEALSRGAHTAIFVENNPKAVECIKENLDFTKLNTNAHVVYGNVLDVIETLDTKCSVLRDRPADIIFMDPPFNNGLEKNCLELLRNLRFVDEYTIIVIEASNETDFDYVSKLGYHIYKIKEYKTNKHIFLQKNEIGMEV